MHNGFSTILQPRRTTGNNSTVHSDNAIYFYQPVIKKYTQSKKIALKFIPPGPPHFVGSWERLIGMCKRLFFNIAGSRKLQEDSFSNLICQVESLNSRPLTSVSSDIRDVKNLTPGHFLTGMTKGLPSVVSSSCNHRGTEKLRNNVNSLLKEYLPTIRQHWKWHSSRRDRSREHGLDTRKQHTKGNLADS